MTRQEVRAYLLRYRWNKKRIRRLAEQIEELRTRKAYPGSPSLDAMPHGSNPSDLSDYAARLDELERELVAEQAAAEKALEEVIRAVNLLESETEKEVLTMYYVRGIRWEKICAEMNYSWQHVFRIRNSAFQNLARLMEDLE